MDFVNKHKKEAFELDLKREYFNLHDDLLKCQQNFNNAETKEERQEIQELVQKMVRKMKESILLTIRRENHLVQYVNMIPPYLLFVRIYLEYKDLYDKVTYALEPQKEKTQAAKTSDKKITEIEKFELLFTKAGYDAEGLRNFFIGCNLGNKNLAILIYHIKKQANLPMSFYLKNFMQWINKEAHYTGVNDYLGKQKKIEFPDAYTDEELQELLDQIEEYKNF